jgi:hypothetical protein
MADNQLLPVVSGYDASTPRGGNEVSSLASVLRETCPGHIKRKAERMEDSTCVAPTASTWCITPLPFRCSMCSSPSRRLSTEKPIGDTAGARTRRPRHWHSIVCVVLSHLDPWLTPCASKKARTPDRPELTNGQFCSIGGQTENSRSRESSLGDSAEWSISVKLTCSQPRGDG